jgi:hypothetical protein
MNSGKTRIREPETYICILSAFEPGRVFFI